MPRGPKAEKRPADAIGNAVMIGRMLLAFRTSGHGYSSPRVRANCSAVQVRPSPMMVTMGIP